MKYYKHISIVLFLPIFILGCKKDWFGIKSDQNLTVPSSLKDFQLLLDNYDVMAKSTPGLGEVASDNYRILEATWQLFSPDNDFNNALTNSYVWSNNRPYRNITDWNESYRKIFVCNLILEGLNEIDSNGAAKNEYNQIKGDALFKRAKTYFELAQLYAVPYTVDSDSPYGLPFKSNADISEKVTRASVFETYNAILKDLEIARDLFPLYPGVLTRGSKLSAWAMLAKVNLTMGNYQEAYNYTDSVLKNKSDLIDFNTLPEPATNLPLFNNEVIFHSIVSTYGFIGMTRAIISDEIINHFVPDDLRLAKLYRKVDSGYNFRGSYSGSVAHFSGITTSEIYLIKAESAVRVGEREEGMLCLNNLLRSRFKTIDGVSTFVDKIALDDAEALEVILKERRVEMVMRGSRWTDLRRLNQDIRFAKTLHRTIGENSYTLEPNSDQYTFPIPEDEISISQIQQNPGWGK